MAERFILHVDMDAFYAAIEQRDRPELKGRPVIVGGTPQGRGVVSAASYEARRFGVHSAMPAAQAVRLCPEGVFLPVDMPRYVRVSRQVRAILARHSQRIEPVSIDEAFLDLTGRLADFTEAEGVAQRIRHEIRQELRLTASVGVAANKFLAKLASDLRKPDGLMVIRPEEAERVLAPLPVGRLWGIGKKTEPRLQAAGLRTIGDVARAPIEQLRRLLGAWGDVVHELARGLDDRPVETEREAKTLSSETTFPRDVEEARELRRVIAELSQEVAARLGKEGVKARTIAIKVRFADFHTITRQATLAAATDRAQVIRRTAERLLEGVTGLDRGVRLLGVRASGLDRGEQLSLFDPRVQRRAELARTVAYLRRRYGESAVRWAREAAAELEKKR